MVAKPTVVYNTVNQLHGVCVELHLEEKTHFQDPEEETKNTSRRFRETEKSISAF